MQNFIQNLTKQVESLRSTVSKNALLGFKDILRSLKKKMDSELDYLIPAAMKKATDTNTFLSKTATEVLISACENCTESKIINVLSSFPAKKAPSAKVKIQI
mmetsp:Transcript_32757/g.29041  ORF Transcript_32757/g.29041 Transcript_32757/m.29041 type:complete len:102 (+) Transcript_32757:311-616(+)